MERTFDTNAKEASQRGYKNKIGKSMPKKSEKTNKKNNNKTQVIKKMPSELKLSQVQPKTEKQQITFEHYHRGKNFMEWQELAKHLWQCICHLMRFFPKNQKQEEL